MGIRSPEENEFDGTDEYNQNVDFMCFLYLLLTQDTPLAYRRHAVICHSKEVFNVNDKNP